MGEAASGKDGGLALLVSAAAVLPSGLESAVPKLWSKLQAAMSIGLSRTSWRLM